MVNADDFGLSPGINRGILESACRGHVSSVSLCVNGRAYGEALALIRENPSLDVGLHIVLVGERPVSRPDRVKTLVDQKGDLHKDAAVFLFRYLTRRIDMRDIESEIIAQFQKARGAGINISHVDSHQHLHMLPGIMGITVRICERYRVPFVRTTYCPVGRHLLSAGKKRILVQLALNKLSALARKKIKSHGLRTVDFSSGALYSGALNEKLFSAFISSLGNGITEIISHPAWSGASIAGQYRKRGYGEGEHEFLVSDKPGLYMQRNGIILSGFSGLAG